MLGVILTGHGSFATGLYQAAVQIIGEQKQFMAIDFPDGMSVEKFKQQLGDALAQCNQGDGAVFLTDILGGSPFHVSAMLSYEHPNIEVIAGTNMPLVLEMMLQREDLNTESFRNQSIDSAQLGVTSLWHEKQKTQPQKKEFLDGI